MLCLKTKTLLCIHFPLSLNYFHPDFSGLCSTKLMHSGDPETTFPLTVCDCLGWRRIISQMAMRQCCHVHMKDVVGQEVRLCCFFKRHIFFSLWFTCPLLWASIEPSLTHPPLLRPWWGSDLEQNIWGSPLVFTFSTYHLAPCPIAPGLMKLGCWGGVGGEPGSLLGLGTSPPGETMQPAPLWGSAAWKRVGDAGRGWPAGHLVTVALRSLHVPTTPGTPSSSVTSLPPTLSASEQANFSEKLPVSGTHAWVAGQERNNTSHFLKKLVFTDQRETKVLPC